MNGILVINKPKGYTSRDVVNIVSRKLNTKKVGHTGTLDPMAEGVLVLCIGNALKLCEMLTNHDKDYIASVILGLGTDTLDVTGRILEDISCHIDTNEIESVLFSFNKTYMQEVPIYSAVKVNGKKLYEYARNNIPVELPKKEVTISNIELIGDVKYNNYHTEFTFSSTVSKGTYIRSLIRDVGASLGCPAVMSSLIRTRQGNFSLKDACSLDDFENGNYTFISPLEAFPNISTMTVDSELLFKIKNGAPIDKFTDCNEKFIVDIDNNLIAIYRNTDDKARVYKMF
ncbi:MAG: tRNA pseudouridine(55) synthase TruB [Bacilli bacterium]|nr:tRNA pseudouridine(55) synthase TruB [Bacilli bacterium]